MWKKSGWLWGVLMAVLFIMPSMAHAQDISKPKVVSLDYCSDQYVLALADRDQIMALSRNATDVHSFYRKRAEGLPQFNSTLEEILALQPDVIARYWSGSGYVDYLHQNGFQVASAGFGHEKQDLIKNIRAIGDALGQTARADAEVAALIKRFDTLEQLPRRPERVLYLTPSGLTAGKNTYVNQLLNLAGFHTMADEYGYNGWLDAKLEHVVSYKPDLVIGSFFDMLSNHNSHWSGTRHGVIGRLLAEVPTIFVPGKYLSCNGVFLPEAAEFIVQAMKELESTGMVADLGVGGVQ